MTTEIISRVQKVPPMWWSAVAGTAAAGAVIFPNARIVAALVGGGAMLALAIKVATPCCDDCAQAAAAKRAEMRATEGIAIGEPAPPTGTGLDVASSGGEGGNVDVGKLLKESAVAKGNGVMPSGSCS